MYWNVISPELENFVRDAANDLLAREMHGQDGSRRYVGGKVYSLENLRIADGSIIARIKAANTMAPCVIIGEHAAPILRDEYHFGVHERTRRKNSYEQHYGSEQFGAGG
jgi:choline dehydrogenase